MTGHRRGHGIVGQLAGTHSGSAQTDVLEELRRVILAGTAAPGSGIPVGEVARVFGVSPIPVREALKTLIGEGLVTHRVNSGYFVSDLTINELREIYFVRGILEQAALSQAVSAVTDADIAAARREHQALQEATITDDRVAYHHHSRMFHTALVTPCAMPRLLTMFDSTWNITEPFQVMRTVTTAMQLQLHADHEKMIAAMAERDAAALVAAARRHHERLESVVIGAGTDNRRGDDRHGERSTEHE
ncbi:GntR family transcriptional regulator [Williamsia sterculiae]|uniref:DNA-binding transcriptional regulator, GntR family n=1 Tax=Williamsia sterculiae TaxID=1344003 RepID=A0A1N7GQW0_9NOCA|nr:GntR family transcriptional regulator [Williamsia sterculiae]SIS14965.1 DNA-binding transcriptional regulator, GntR family [Williamsia sterculiae]